MKKRSIVLSAISAALVLSSCAGTDELSHSLYSMPSVNSSRAEVTGSTIEITLHASATGTNFRECGFYYGTDQSLSDAIKLTATTGSSFSSSFVPDGYGKTYYWQAYLTSNGAEVRSSVTSVKSLTFPEYVKVSVPVTEITPQGAVTVAATIDIAEGIVLTDKGVCYSEKAAPTVSSAKVSSGTGSGSIAATIEGFALGSTCHLRCYARQGDEVSYSDEVTVVPSKAPTVTTAAVTDITFSTAECGGDVTSDGGAAVTARGVVWSTEQNPTVELSTKTSDGTGIGSFTSSLTGLSDNTLYYIRAYAINSEGISYGEQFTFTTAEFSTNAVNLGLSVCWASMNVGAETYTNYGDYYAWGETTSKSYYTWNTYQWCNGSYTTMTKYCTSSQYGTVDNKTVLESSDDVAHVKWGGSWRIPTSAEWQELYDNCTWIWTTISGVDGFKVTSKKTGYTDKWIFLPAAGCRYDTGLYGFTSDGWYWSSSLYSGDSDCAFSCWFCSDEVAPRGSDYRCFGLTVRLVCE